jgi:hypothetical protein
MARHAYRAKVLNLIGELVHHVSHCEAAAMVESGHARRVSRSKATTLVVQLTVQRQLEVGTRDATITLQEMQANAFGAAGIVRRRGFVDRSMDKIEVWPTVGDTLAVRVGPRATHA